MPPSRHTSRQRRSTRACTRRILYTYINFLRLDTVTHKKKEISICVNRRSLTLPLRDNRYTCAIVYSLSARELDLPSRPRNAKSELHGSEYNNNTKKEANSGQSRERCNSSLYTWRKNSPSRLSLLAYIRETLRSPKGSKNERPSLNRTSRLLLRDTQWMLYMRRESPRR